MYRDYREIRSVNIRNSIKRKFVKSFDEFGRSSYVTIHLIIVTNAVCKVNTIFMIVLVHEHILLYDLKRMTYILVSLLHKLLKF